LHQRVRLGKRIRSWNHEFTGHFHAVEFPFAPGGILIYTISGNSPDRFITIAEVNIKSL